MITQEQLEQALQFLGETDNDYSYAKANYLYQVQNLKIVRSLQFLDVDGGSVEHRKATAEASEAYREALHAYRDSAYEYERVSAKRRHAELQIEVWRSLSSARNHGQIV